LGRLSAQLGFLGPALLVPADALGTAPRLPLVINQAGLNFAQFLRPARAREKAAGRLGAVERVGSCDRGHSAASGAFAAGEAPSEKSRATFLLGACPIF